MSKVKTDAIETRAGGTSVLTIGTATQTIKLPGGSPGAGKFLQSDADGDASWATVAGGLSRTDTWFLNTDMTITDGTVTDITAWTRWNDSGYSGRLLGSIGTAFASPSSGKWTFPETGIWQVCVNIWYTPYNGYYNQAQTYIWGTEDDGSNWYKTGAYMSPYAANTEQGGGYLTSMPLNIADLSNDKVKVTVNRSTGGVAYMTINGNSTEPETSITFVKIG